MRKKIAFIGVGNMASAILRGITSRESEAVLWSDIILYNRHKEKIEKYKTFGAVIADTLEEAIYNADCVLLCVKPQNFSEILPRLSAVDEIEKKLFVSIAAGVSVSIATSYLIALIFKPKTKKE